MAGLSLESGPTTRPAIGLWWEGRDESTQVVQREDAVWVREATAANIDYRGLTNFDWHGEDLASPSALVIAGDRIAALEYLARTAPGYFALVHVELSRTVLDDKELQFRADDPLPDRVWLELSETLIGAARRLARPDGVVSVMCGDDDVGLARVLCDELLGRPCRIGDVVWQKAYAPHDQKATKKLAGVHDSLLLYAVSPTLLRPVGLRGAGEGVGNADDDPRGPWIAEHKGAPSKRSSTDFDAFRPPYRWELLEGELPPGVWRVSPMTGVIWGEPEEPGIFEFKVGVTDAAGSSGNRNLTIEVEVDGVAPAPQRPQGILEPLPAQKGKLRVATASLPTGVVGQPYYAALEAAGGEPHAGPPVRPNPPRYWEFSERTLATALVEDRVDFGAKGTAIARIKRYPDPDADVENQTTWWPGRRALSGKKQEVFAGYSQDARKHLQALKQGGLVGYVPPSAKPEALMARLIDIFVPVGGPVLEVNAESGELAAVAIKRARPAVCLTGNDDRSRRYREECLVPRLRAVISGDDKDLMGGRGEPLSTDVYIPYEGGGLMAVCEIGPVLATYDPAGELFELQLSGDGVDEAVLTGLGFLPSRSRETTSGLATGTSLDGRRQAVCLPPGQFLTPELALDLSEAGLSTIAYFRGEGLERGLIEAAGTRFTTIRIPYDLPR